MQLKSRFGTSYYLSWHLGGVIAETTGLLAVLLAALLATFLGVGAFDAAPVGRLLGVVLTRSAGGRRLGGGLGGSLGI